MIAAIYARKSTEQGGVPAETEDYDERLESMKTMERG
jgi:hypothetical protein